MKYLDNNNSKSSITVLFGNKNEELPASPRSSSLFLVVDDIACQRCSRRSTLCFIRMNANFPYVAPKVLVIFFIGSVDHAQGRPLFRIGYILRLDAELSSVPLSLVMCATRKLLTWATTRTMPNCLGPSAGVHVHDMTKG